MAKGQHLSSYQRGIVRRFYQHHETIVVRRLSEGVSDLALAMAEGDGEAAKKKQDRLWKKLETELRKLRLDPPLSDRDFEETVGRRDLEKTGALIHSLAGPK